MIPSGPGSSPKHIPIPWTRMFGSLKEATHGHEAIVPDGVLHAITTKEPGGWHLSVSFKPTGDNPLRLPTWDELKDARYRFVPDRFTMAALLPPRAEWVDFHPTALHLWQIPDDLGEQTRHALSHGINTNIARVIAQSDGRDWEAMDAVAQSPYYRRAAAVAAWATDQKEQPT